MSVCLCVRLIILIIHQCQKCVCLTVCMSVGLIITFKMVVVVHVVIISFLPPGDLGPVYGFQWRHYGASYVDMHTDYSGQGVDQLAKVIHTIKNKPNDRRIIMCAWNPIGEGNHVHIPVLVPFHSCPIPFHFCLHSIPVPFHSILPPFHSISVSIPFLSPFQTSPRWPYLPAMPWFSSMCVMESYPASCTKDQETW